MERRAYIAQVPIDCDLDVTTVQRSRKVIDGLIDDGCRRIVLNMSGCSYLDSAGMALLFREIRRMREAGGLVSLVNVSDRVLRSLRIARVVDFAPVTGAGAHREVADLDPTVVPNWRTTLSVDARHLSQTRARVEQLVGRMPFSPDQMFDITLAVGEAMGNAVDELTEAAEFVTADIDEDGVALGLAHFGLA